MKDIRMISRDAKINRTEALSDGVFAIVMTILVLELIVPDIPGQLAERQLHLKLLETWPRFAAYAFSFIVLGILWSLHHIIFQYIKRVNYRIIWINIIFLMFIAMAPFSTAMIGKYTLSTTAVVFYGTNSFLNMLMINILLWYVSKNKQLLINDITSREIMQVKISWGLALGLFLIAIGLSFIKPYIGIIMYFLIIVLGIIAIITSRNIRPNFKKN